MACTIFLLPVRCVCTDQKNLFVFWSLLCLYCSARYVRTVQPGVSVLCNNPNIILLCSTYSPDLLILCSGSVSVLSVLYSPGVSVFCESLGYGVSKLCIPVYSYFGASGCLYTPSLGVHVLESPSVSIMYNTVQSRCVCTAWGFCTVLPHSFCTVEPDILSELWILSVSTLCIPVPDVSVQYFGIW